VTFAERSLFAVELELFPEAVVLRAAAERAGQYRAATVRDAAALARQLAEPAGLPGLGCWAGLRRAIGGREPCGNEPRPSFPGEAAPSPRRLIRRMFVAPCLANEPRLIRHLFVTPCLLNERRMIRHMIVAPCLQRATPD
jgi:hypothetical protein